MFVFVLVLNNVKMSNVDKRFGSSNSMDIV